MGKVTLRGETPITTLAETYFRLGITLSETDKALLREYLQKRAVDYARGLFQQTPEFLVTIDDGSLKGKLRVVGHLVFAAFTTYGAIRATIDYMVHDSQKFSDRVISDVRETGIPEEKVLRTERRLGTPGKLKRLLKRIDVLKARGRDMSRAEYDQEMDKVHGELTDVLRQAANDEEAKLIQQRIHSAIQAKVPERLPFPKLPLQERVALLPRRDRTLRGEIVADEQAKKVDRSRDVLYRAEIRRSKLYLRPIDD
jgi:hypothetical protein